MGAFLEMIGITKVYGNGAVANDKVDISFDAAEIHAVAGENGAGKSTVMKVLYGLEKKDSGLIRINGKDVSITSPDDAMRLGIGMVHQHFMLVNELPVYQNIFLGHEPTRNGLLDKGRMVSETLKLSELYGMDVDPYAKCASLPVSAAQKVEILKALSRSAKLLILDEPTAVLTPQETKELFLQLKLLREKGSTIVLITHKLKEILELCDRVTVMRAGRSLGVHKTAGLSEAGLSRLMIGRVLEPEREKRGLQTGETVLEVRGLYVKGAGGKPKVDNVSFTVKKGEILCLAGVEGNGQREVIRSVTGLSKDYTGSIKLCGRDIRRLKAGGIRSLGLSHIPEDRQASGSNAEADILDNLISVSFRKNSILGFIRYRRLRKKADEQIKSYKIIARSRKQKLGMLSGGNMQKVVVAREMEENPRLLVADQPTRGVDVGAMEFIHRKLTGLRDDYGAVLLLSADLDEVFRLSDRILVFHEGRITAEVTDVGSTTAEQLGRYMLGIDRTAGYGV